MRQAFVASASLRPMAQQLLQDRTPPAYTGVEAYARAHTKEDAGALAWLVLGYAHVLDRDFLGCRQPVVVEVADGCGVHVLERLQRRGVKRGVAAAERERVSFSGGPLHRAPGDSVTYGDPGAGQDRDGRVRADIDASVVDHRVGVHELVAQFTEPAGEPSSMHSSRLIFIPLTPPCVLMYFTAASAPYR